MMIRTMTCALSAVIALASTPAGAQENRPAEIGAGLFQHATTPPFNRDAPRGSIYEGTEEQGSLDVEILYRTRPLGFALKPRITAKAQINTRGRTSFASAGLEWRQHILHDQVYGQIGIGITVHDGRLFNPDPYAPGLSNAEAWRRYDIAFTHNAFGSRVLFNPNLSIGIRLDRQWAIEAAYEHYSHRRIFNAENEGIDNIGLRLVRAIGR